jgi:2-keto-4-pentenoate hydratase/2-oxohepta-3-ene-1,7-dioic acid hydratase in catechol pathway
MIKLPVAGSSKMIPIAPSKIVAVGLNYREHVKESAANLPAEPVLFSKTPNSLVGPGEKIVLPGFIKDYHFPNPRVDLEAELAVIIGKRGRHVPPEKALDHVLGYTCFNDVSQRNLQSGDISGWFRGKSLDTFGPIGPVIVPQGALNHQELNILSRINGETKQSGNTRDMIFSVAALIAFITKCFTLEEGDIIATGTPSGVSPIKHGDTVEIEIEGIGILQNPVVDEG